MFDDKRGLSGHGLNNEFDIPIPAFIWVSDSFIEQMPAKVEAVSRNSKLPISTKSAFYTLADLGGLQISDERMGKNSLMSQDFQKYPRRFRKGEVVLDYDQWFNMRDVQEK